MKSNYASMQSRLGFGDLELLLALSRGRTLAGAAERLKVDASTVFRSVRRLEKDLGEVLFDRSRQGYTPTDLGRDLALQAERMESLLHEAREIATKNGGEPVGTLRISTTDTILHSVLLPLMADFSRAYPKIDVELIVTNALANLSRRDADVALRATRKPPGHLVGNRLGTIRSSVFAGKHYLGLREPVTALAELDWIGLDESLPDHPSQKWRRQQYPGVQPRFRMNSVLAVAGAVVAGMGVGVVPQVVLAQHPEVEIVHGPVPELDTDLWVLAHPDTRRLQRVKALFDFLREKLVLP